MLESNYPLSEHNVQEEWKLQLHHYKNLKTCQEYRDGEKAATFFNGQVEEEN
jgi:hypothetical protein